MFVEPLFLKKRDKAKAEAGEKNSNNFKDDAEYKEGRRSWFVRVL